jgi:hypothetical protein
MAMTWTAFAYDAANYAYEGVALEKAWPDLHRGDCEPFPNPAFVKLALAAHRRLKCSLDPDKAAAALQSAWRAYHRGDFGAAVEQGAALGPIGANAANKAASIYATYLETDSGRKREILLEAAERAEALQAVAPDFPNAFHFHAQALGRYARENSVGKALAQGIGAKVKASLDRVIALEPEHAEAHIALGAYHAEIVNKVGALLAGLSYGASREHAVKHFAIARKLLPDSAIARIEEAKGLVMLFGASRLAEAERLYREAARIAPADAMQKLDAEHAKEEAEG